MSLCLTVKRLVRACIVCIAPVLAAAACSSGPVAPRASWPNEPAARDFLSRVDRACGNHGVGGETVGFELDSAGNDTRFVKLTTKLFLGEITRQGYARKINAFFPGDVNRKAFDCIFAELG